MAFGLEVKERNPSCEESYRERVREREREGREGGKSGDLRIINEDTSPFRRLALLPSYKYLLRNANVLKKTKN